MQMAPREVNIKLIAHPTFALSCQCKDKELGVNALNEALGYVEKAIKERKGTGLLSWRVPVSW